MKPPACVLFDLDETLVHYDHAVRVRTLAERVGVEPARIEAELFASGLEHDSDLGRYDAQGQADALAARLGVPVGLTDCIAARAASMLVDDEVLALARSLAASTAVAILTNNGLLVRDHLPALCPALSPLFDGRVLCSAEFGVGKPDPAIYAHAAARVGHAPDAILFVDDKAANTEAAAASGMRAHHHRGVEGLRAAFVVHGLLPENRDAS